MFYDLFNIIAPVLVCTSIGYIWHRAGFEYRNEFVMHVVMNIGAPCLVISAFNSNDISLAAFSKVALVAVIVMLGSGLLAWPFAYRAQGDTVSMLAPVAFPNWGNMGLALCLFAFGKEGLALGLAFFMTGMIVQLIVGFPLFMRGSQSITSQVIILARQPVLYAVVISLLIVGFDLSLPVWLANTTDLLGGLTIPLMLITLGVSLATFQGPRWFLSLGFSLLRVVGGLLIGSLAVWALGISGVEKNVILLQSMMPAAIFNYLFAAYFKRDPEITAGIVITSTLLAFILVPVMLGFLI